MASGNDISMDDDVIVGLTTNIYETQFFNFTPKSFSDGIYTAMSAYMVDARQMFQQYMKDEFRLSDEEAAAGSAVIKNTMSKVLDKACDKLENYVAESTFKMPSHVVLPEDRVQVEYERPVQEAERLERKIQNLNEKIKNAKYYNAALKQEINQADQVQDHLEKQLEYFHSLENIIRDASLKESLAFVHDETLKMKKIVDGFELKSPDASSQRETTRKPTIKSKKRLKLE